MADGRAVAITWRPYWMALAYMILLAGAVRFLHFALFEGSLLTARFFLVDLAVLAILSTISYRVTRVRQMTSQYPGSTRLRDLLHGGNAPDRILRFHLIQTLGTAASACNK